MSHKMHRAQRFADRAPVETEHAGRIGTDAAPRDLNERGPRWAKALSPAQCAGKLRARARSGVVIGSRE